MKRENLFSFLSAIALSFCLSFGGVSCMVTGLNLSCSLLDLAVCLAPVCVVCGFLLSLRRGGIALSGLLAAALLLGLASYGFRQEALSMAGHIAEFYQKGYELILPDILTEVTTQNHLMPALAIATAIAAAACWTVLRRIPASLSVFLSLLPIGLCCVVTDTVPSLWCILLWLAGLVILLLTHPVRLQDALHGAQLTALLAIPTALALTVLAIAMPQSSYRPPDMEFSDFNDLGGWFSSRLPSVGQTSEGDLVISFGSDLADRVELDRLDGAEQGTSAIMEVQTDFSGTLYLRGQDHDLYDGVSWSSSPEREETDLRPSALYTEADGTVSLRMLNRHNRIYLPYWPAQAITLVDGSVDNADQLTEYSFTRVTLTKDWHKYWIAQNGPTRPWLQEDGAYGKYLELPDSTREQAEILLNQLSLSGALTGDAVDQAEAIAAYVRDSAVYDLNAPQMPEGYEDLAIWFLTEADSGYCTHFATATTVLLRAAGIPARYVEGYLTEVTANRPNIVRQNMAHAWAEYYLDGLGWLPLEATPGYSEEEPVTVTDPTAPEVSDPTQPSETMRPTETTQPTQPTVTDPTDPEVTDPSETATVPSLPGEIKETPDETSPWLAKLLLWLAVVAGSAAAIVGQWLLRRRYRLLRQHRGSPNAQGIARFREAKRLSRLAKLPLPEELCQLADKACFSQHQLNAQELAVFDGFLKLATARLKAAKLPLRLVYRFFFAAY